MKKPLDVTHTCHKEDWLPDPENCEGCRAEDEHCRTMIQAMLDSPFQSADVFRKMFNEALAVNMSGWSVRSSGELPASRCRIDFFDGSRITWEARVEKL